MSSLSHDFLRRLVPRWRYASPTVVPAETVADRPSVKQSGGDERFWEEKRADWAEEPRIETAAELLSCATALNRLGQVQDVIRYLGAHRESLRPGPAELLAYADSRVHTQAHPPASEMPAGAAYMSGSVEARAVIGRSRALLAGTPRDALAWMDMSRAYTTLGQHLHAETAISRALSLAPNARIIIRAACRRLVHADRTEEAHRLLMRHRRTRHDPWLLAAEIALAQILDETPRLTREGRALLNSGKFSPAGITELAGALGTLEFINGATKRARRLVQLSVEAPSDNAVAQARWIAARAGGIQISEHAWRTPLSYEAWCWRAYQSHEWERSLVFAKAWVHDEPFSSRAAVQATFLATAVMEDYTYAIDCAREVLVADNSDSMLRNNLIVALAYANRVEEARVELAKVGNETDPDRSCTNLATRGLVEMRSGNTLSGRGLYRQAYDCASPAMRLRVFAHWLKEEVRVDSRGSQPILERAGLVVGKQGDPIASRVVELTTSKYRRSKSDSASTSEPLKELDRLLPHVDG
jgi:Flp pilus assembly protein TadD